MIDIGETVGMILDFEEQRQVLIEKLKNEWENKDNHLIMRFILWDCYSNKEKHDYFTDLCNYNIFDGYRYETTDIDEKLNDYLTVIDFPYCWNDRRLDINKSIKSCIDWYENLPEKADDERYERHYGDEFEPCKDYLGNMFEDLIRLNLSSFVNDR